AAVERVVGKEERGSAAEVCGDYGGVLSKCVAMVEKAGDQQVLRIGVAKQYLRAVLLRDHIRIVARLLDRERHGLPWLGLGQRWRLGKAAVLRDVRIVRTTAAGGARRLGFGAETAVAGK